MKNNRPHEGNLLSIIPRGESPKKGWPWTKETDSTIYYSLSDLPTISIVIPTRNQGHFIEETIRSVLLQNYPNLELIIIDGNSTDQTKSIIEKYNQWIDYWESKDDRGQTHAINKGFRRASGTFINWLNSDDLLEKNGLFNLLKGFEKYKDAAFIHGQRRILAKDGSIEASYPDSFSNLKYEYFGSFPYLQPASFYRKSILETIGYLDESFYSTMDLDLFTRIALNYQMYYIDAPVAVYREQPDAKTYMYNALWDNERVRVINKFMRSVSPENYVFENMQKFNILIEESDVYPTTKTFSDQEINQILAIFIRDSIHLNFHGGFFKKTYFLANNLRKIYPEYFSEQSSFYYFRSMIYRFQILYSLSRILFKIKQML